MNRKLLNTKISPRQAIVVYHNKDKSDFYLESRQIREKGGKYALMAAQPMSENVLRELARVYMKKSGVDMDFGGVIDEHILFTCNKPGQNAVMWYRPSMKRRLNFDNGLRIKNSDKPAPVPATLYFVFNQKLYIFSLMGNERPTVKTKLYKAPFFNIYKDGQVCLGSAEVGKNKAKTYALEADRYERAFYMAEQNGGLADNVCKRQLAPLWSDVISRGRQFPSKQQLVPHSKFKTVQQLIDSLIGKNLDYDSYDDEDENFEEEDVEIEIG